MIVSIVAANAGKFGFEIWSNNDLVEIGRNYPTFHEAQAAAEIAHREFHLNKFKVPDEVIVTDYMSLEDIFADLD